MAKSYTYLLIKTEQSLLLCFMLVSEVSHHCSYWARVSSVQDQVIAVILFVGQKISLWEIPTHQQKDHANWGLFLWEIHEPDYNTEHLLWQFQYCENVSGLKLICAPACLLHQMQYHSRFVKKKHVKMCRHWMFPNVKITFWFRLNACSK